ncbi:MAG: FAD binding domain-containing protein [Proteobacteria bacterium]|nr:FAD binding domain-containing protein [Pseudomonadota bacterium]MDA1354900.1 FAD binding domain-containing protein [Pseudomonadota bacterium]
MTNPRVVVIGGSLGGLLAANMLWRAGCDVTVHERIGEELSGRGAGIAAHPEMFAAFDQAGVNMNDAIGTSVEERIVLARDGSVMARHRLPQIMCSWSSLLALLRAAFPADRYFPGMEFSRAEQTDAGVRALFANSTVIDADLLIGADGIYSTLRRQYWPDAKPVYAGYVAWRGIVPEAAVSRETHDALFSLYAFCLPSGEHMLGYPITGEGGDVRPGHRRYNIVWYRRVEDNGALRRLMTDETGKHHPFGIPPGLIRGEAVAELRAAADANLAPQFREMVELIETPFFQSVVDMDVPAMVSGRALLLGDAAFLARPHCGMGVTKAAGDAVLLAELLTVFADDISHALEVYDTERCRYGRYLTAHSQRLGSQMKRSYATEEERAEAEYYRRPETCLRNISLPPDPP